MGASPDALDTFLAMAGPLILGGGLLLVRLVALLAFVPGFASGTLPVAARAVFAVVLTLIVDLALGPVAVDPPAGPLILALRDGREVLIGGAMSLALRLLLAAVESAGVLASSTMGLAMNVMVDPRTGDQTMPLGTLLGICATLIFVALDGHHLVLVTFVEHARRFPVGEATLAVPSLGVLAEAVSHLLRSAVLLAAPVLGITLVLNVAIAFVSRVVPSVNLFGIGLGLLLLGGFVALGMQGDAVTHYLDQELGELPRRMVELAGTPRG